MNGAISELRIGRSGSPFGTVSYAYSRRGLVAMGFTDRPDGLHLATYGVKITSDKDSDQVQTALLVYFSGRFTALDELELDLPNTNFYDTCRRKLRDVKAGTTISYSGLATLAGRPNAYRSAASACSSNPVALVVPCHRVLPSSGRVGNYGFGTEVKAGLLKLEGAHFID